MSRSATAAKISFAKRCGCINHDIFAENGCIKFSLRCRSYFAKRMEFHELKRRGLVQDRVKDICTVCLAYAREKLNSTETPSGSSQETLDLDIVETIDADTSSENEDMVVGIENAMDTDTADEMADTNEKSSLVIQIKHLTTEVSAMKWDDLNDEEQLALSGLACALGKTIRTSIDAEKKIMSKECATLDNIISLDRRDWYQQRNLLLRKFLEGCTGVNEETKKNKKFNSCIHSIEQIMYTQNNNMVTAFAYQRSIISYLISKSRTVSTLMGSWESSGSYTKIIDLICSPSAPLLMPDNCDITITFDNEQKVGRHTGRLREGSKQSCSIITTVATIKTNPLSQCQFKFSPKLIQNPSFHDMMEKVNRLEDEYRKIMRRYRTKYMEDIFREVINEQQFNPVTSKMSDYIDIAISHEGQYVCRCAYISSTIFEICPSCKTNSSYFNANYDKYSRTESCHDGDPPEVKNAEPFMVNPASKENVKLILTGLREQAIVTAGRKWVPVVCDGSPYVLAAHMLDYTKQCSVCSEFVDSKCLQEHSELHEMTNTYAETLSGIVLRPGSGHIEMNMARLLLTFLWIPLIEELSDSFGFRTPKAKFVFKQGIDHHRTRQVLEACLNALTKELVVPYIRHCVEVNNLPSCDGFMNWYDEDVNSQNYAFYYHVTFSYLLPFHFYNESVRKNNSSSMMAARSTFAPLFFSSYHPKYQKLLLRDSLQRTNYSPEVSDYMTLTESFSVSGKDNSGQGGDFIHEEQNKTIKSFIPPIGVPSKETWRNVIRKMETLKKMKDALLASCEITFNSVKRPKHFEHEITMIRRKVRKAKYFEKYHDESELLVSITGKKLDDSLCDFNFAAQDNYKMYKEELVENGTYGTKKMQPVFITTEERDRYNAIESKTKAEIKKQIESLLNTMPNLDVAASLRGLLVTKKST